MSSPCGHRLLFNLTLMIDRHISITNSNLKGIAISVQFFHSCAGRGMSVIALTQQNILSPTMLWQQSPVPTCCYFPWRMYSPLRSIFLGGYTLPCDLYHVASGNMLIRMKTRFCCTKSLKAKTLDQCVLIGVCKGQVVLPYTWL